MRTIIGELLTSNLQPWHSGYKQTTVADPVDITLLPIFLLPYWPPYVASGQPGHSDIIIVW